MKMFKEIGIGLAKFTNCASCSNEDIPRVYSPLPDNINYILDMALVKKHLS